MYFFNRLFLKFCNRMFYSTAPPACSLRINKVGQINIQLPLLTITMVKTDNRYPKRLLAQMYKLYILYFCDFLYTTSSHYSRSISHTVLRGSCLLYYRTCHCVCHFRSSLSATAIKNIILYCTCY